MGGSVSVDWKKQLSQFQLVDKNFQHPYFGTIDIYTLKSDPTIRIMKIASILSEATVNDIKQRIKIKHINLLRVLKVAEREGSNKSCMGSPNAIYDIFIEYPGDYVLNNQVNGGMSLYDIVNKKHTKFQEQHLWKIISSVSSAVLLLQSNKRFVGNFGLDNIYIDMDKINLIESNIIPSVISSYKYILSGGDEAILSPEQFDELKVQNKNPKYNPYKSDVFCFGYLLLQLTTHCSTNEVYDFRNQTYNYTRLQQLLESIRNKYSFLFYSLVKKMLSKPSDRPTWSDMNNLLQQYDSQIKSEYPFYLEIIPSPNQTGSIQGALQAQSVYLPN